MTLPVLLDVRADAPGDGWDHVTETGLRVPSGRILVSTFDCRHQIPRTEVPPGDYTARVYAKGFDTITEDRIHDDLYRVVPLAGPGARTPRPQTDLGSWRRRRAGRTPENVRWRLVLVDPDIDVQT
ncbi:hypothetical protein [Amycolatopsis rubida]|uniref:Uncharacterized protein n=1 Tax=Amycolatopsis rubida TaxID=112413 RepID=A0A1I5KGD4_9PSEU|nr:hypothetical protein [Amycolatopsis rubida]SFO84057.1 hypothetical protein SAMN05421854_103178 [Amycolatopsis rubida]